MAEHSGRYSRDFADLDVSRFLNEPHDSGFARATIWALILGLIVFFAWAALTPVYEVVTGNGTLRPEGLTKQVEHLEGGQVAELFVSEGDIVSEGDLILKLDDTALQAERNKLLAQEMAQLGTLARYRDLLDEEEAENVAREAPDLLQSDPAFAADAIFRLAQIEVLRAEARMKSAEIDSLQDRHIKLREELTIMSAQLERYEERGAQGSVPINQLEALRRERLRLESEHVRLNGEIQVQMAALKQLAARERELAASYRRDAALMMVELEATLVATRQSLNQIADRIARLEVRAPADGIVQFLGVSNVGQVLGSGALVAEIVPKNREIFAEIEVSADRIAGVTVGRDASLKVLTHDFTRFGVIDAKVSQISPSSFVTEDGRTVFRVRLALQLHESEDEVAPVEKRVISPGMTVSADIRADQRTVLTYLLKPMRVLSDRAFSES